jgi:hypothetical protein
MIKFLISFLLISCSLLAEGQFVNYDPKMAEIKDDSLVWQTALSFSNLFDSGDTAAMNRLLPEDFILQWMHENFSGKKELLNAMANAAVRAAMAHTVAYDEKAILRLSDDHKAASINTTFVFVDANQTKSIDKSQGFGLCIFYLQKQNGKWVIKTVHLDLHCRLCNF